MRWDDETPHPPRSQNNFPWVHILIVSIIVLLCLWGLVPTIGQIIHGTN